MKKNDRLKLPTKEATENLLYELYWEFRDYKEELINGTGFANLSFQEIVTKNKFILNRFSQILLNAKYPSLKREFRKELEEMKGILDEAKKRISQPQRRVKYGAQ